MSEPALTSLRLPQYLLDRADRLVPTVHVRAQKVGTMSTTRSDVLRLALSRGLSALEAELGVARRRK